MVASESSVKEKIPQKNKRFSFFCLVLFKIYIEISVRPDAVARNSSKYAQPRNRKNIE